MWLSIVAGVLLISTAVYAQPADSLRQETIPAGLSQPQAQELAQNFHATGEKLYAMISAVWTNHGMRAQAAQQFIRENPKYEYWVRTAHLIALAAFDKLNQPDSIHRLVPNWLQQYPNDPFALATSAYFYLYYDLDTVAALDYSLRAAALYDRYKSHPFFTESYYRLDRHGLYNTLHLTEAWSRIKLGQYDRALALLEKALRETPSTIDDGFSPAPYHYLSGLAWQGRGNADSALHYFAEAYRYGEGRNRWTARAERDFTELAGKTYGRDSVPTSEVRALMRRSAGYSGVYFEDVTQEKGLAGRIDRRAAWGDCNNDGYPDLLLDGRTVLRNKRDGTFEKSELPGSNIYMIGGLWGDYDGDGLHDILSIASGSEKLWHNDANGAFRDVTDTAGGIGNPGFTEGAAWVDVDANGYPDVYFANYEQWTSGGSKTFFDEFWYNGGGKGFTNAGQQYGLAETDGKPRAGRGVAPCDFDGDGDVDLYISNYRLHDNLLFENTPGSSPQFANTAAQHGVAGVAASGLYGHTTGSAWGDYDNDGDFDLLVANLAHPRYIDYNNRTMLYENLGAPDYKFRDRRAEAGIVYEETHTDPGFADFDGDGWLDIFITSTYEDRRSFLYINNRNGTFRQVTGLANARVLDGFGWAAADYDLDGDLDLATGTGVVFKTGVHLLENKLNDDPATRVHWLHVRVRGTTNTWGYGAVVRATQGSRTQMRQIDGARGTTSQDYPTAYFAFGKNAGAVELEVTLPGGKVLRKTVSELDRVVVIEE